MQFVVVFHEELTLERRAGIRGPAEVVKPSSTDSASAMILSQNFRVRGKNRV